MSGYDYDRPFITADKLSCYRAIDRDVTQRYGELVKAAEMSNVEYKMRFDKLASKQRMKPPPRTGRIFSGWLVVRRLGSPDEYETWIPGGGFEELYAAAG
jgi:hypothetical protein